MAYNSAHKGTEIDAAVSAVKQKESVWDNKQDGLTGEKGKFVGFTETNILGAMDAPGFPFEVEILETICDDVVAELGVYNFPTPITLDADASYYLMHNSTVIGQSYSSWAVSKVDANNQVKWGVDDPNATIVTMTSTDIQGAASPMKGETRITVLKIKIKVPDDELLLFAMHSSEGYNTLPSGAYSHAEGSNTTASGAYSHAEGRDTTASGVCSHAGGRGTIADAFTQTAIGLYNVKYTTYTSDTQNYNAVFIIGDGSSSSDRSNCFRVGSSKVWGGTYASSGADYAEYFEWLDDNPNHEDRTGLFVTLDGEKIRLAQPEDDYILGVVSGNPSIAGDVHDDQWSKMYVRDVFGRPVYETVEVPEELGPDGEVLVEAHTATQRKLNPEYDNTQKYLARSDRPEWDAVGMMGKLVALDDGTCEVNSYCSVGVGGIATKSNEKTPYRVMARLDDTHVRLLIQ